VCALSVPVLMYHNIHVVAVTEDYFPLTRGIVSCATHWSPHAVSVVDESVI